MRSTCCRGAARRALWLALVSTCTLALVAQSPAIPPGASLTTGFATAFTPVSLTDRCTNPKTTVQPDVFPTRVGAVRSADGKEWIVPGAIHDGSFAVDLYNDCTGAGENADWQRQLETVVIDEDGVEITGYIFADNYYELYVNGRFVARDRVAMTPFNSTVVRFRANYPMTYAIKAIDWETRHGLGMEYASASTSATVVSLRISATALAPTRTGEPRPSTSRRSTIRSVCAPLADATRASARRPYVPPARRTIRPPAAPCTSPSPQTGCLPRSIRAHGRGPSSGGRSR